jgi:hypothetical protein
VNKQQVRIKRFFAFSVSSQRRGQFSCRGRKFTGETAKQVWLRCWFKTVYYEWVNHTVENRFELVNGEKNIEKLLNDIMCKKKHTNIMRQLHFVICMHWKYRTQIIMQFVKSVAGR